jgi:hypothetical protein
MYSIYADDYFIYSGIYLEDERYKITKAKLTLSDNSAGQFDFTIPRTNSGYDRIIPMDTTITIKKNNRVFWEGRVISGNLDFKKNKRVVCEGALAYLNDTIQPPTNFSTKSITDYLSILLRNHNTKVKENRRIQLGRVTVVDSAFVMSSTATNYTVTYDAVDALVSKLGGHLIIRYENNTRYLDYLSEYPNECEQTIEFGKNLLDLAQNFDETEYCTVVIPLGMSEGPDPNTGIETYLTVESVNHGSMYIASTDAVNEHGRLEKVVNFDDIEDATLLYALGMTYLLDTQFNNMVLDVSALDLNLIDKTIDEINLLDKIRVISKPHGINKVFPVQKVTLDLLAPENNSYILGSNNQETLSQQTNNANAELSEKINQLKATNALEFYRFENKDQYTVRRRTRLCNIRFATKAAGLISWQAEILAQVTADEGKKAKVKFYYFLNNVPIEYFPTETLETGEHIFSLYFPLEIEARVSYEWRVEVEVTDGQIIIPIGNMRGVIWGDKLVAQVGWNGYIDIFEEFDHRIALGKEVIRKSFSIATNVTAISPVLFNPTARFERVNLKKDVIKHNYDATPIFNHTSIFAEGLTWGDLRDEYTWAEVFDKHTW